MYRLTSAQGNAGAQSCLGRLFEYGHGVAQDSAEAIRLYRLAAAQGNASATATLMRLGACDAREAERSSHCTRFPIPLNIAARTHALPFYIRLFSQINSSSHSPPARR